MNSEIAKCSLTCQVINEVIIHIFATSIRMQSPDRDVLLSFEFRFVLLVVVKRLRFEPLEFHSSITTMIVDEGGP